MPSLWSRLLPSALRKHLALRVHRDAVARRERALEAPRKAQRAALQSVLQLNQQTEFGRTHGFASITDLTDFATRVPVRGYGQYAPFLERQARGGEILVSCPLATLVEHAEPVAPSVPLTAAGLEQWQFWETLLQDYALRQGRDVVDGVWASIPPLRPKTPPGATEGRLPVADRWDLLGPARAGAARDPLPPALWEVDEEDDRYYAILRLLLDQPLQVLRAESPGTLAILADHLEQQAEKLIDHLASGLVETKSGVTALPRSLKARPERARMLERLRREHGRLEPQHVWPGLQLLLCQTSGSARAAAERLPDRYGDVLCLDPGLVVAGAPITTASDLDGLGGWALLEGQVLELQPAGAAITAPATSPFELEAGTRYSPVITCHNGLYRYRSGRLVEVTEIDERGTPRLAPAGRRETEVEVEGRQLGERDVRHAQREACRALDVIPRGQSCFLQQLEGLPQVGSEAEERPIWARLFSREPARALDPKAPHLCWAIEPSEPLSSEHGRKLLAHFEAALRQKSSSFTALRGEQALGLALLVLRHGSFSRRAHRRLADGTPGAHAPVGALLERPLVLSADEVDRRIA